MKMKWLRALALTLVLVPGIAGAAEKARKVSAPRPCGAVPTPQQVDWLRMEWYAFVHFGINTYTGKEWGYGNESPSLFNPSDFNADEIVKTFKQAGMKGMIYTAKHHDGFCLWPTKSTGHNISASPWKGGKGDVVREFANACKKYRMKFGTYLSPWDRNSAEYGKPGYLRVYYKQIEELLTNYGPIFEIWFDGANGGDGFYGGAKEKRNIGKAEDYYNFKQVVKNIRRLQPNCIIWGAEKHGDVIWGGSEKGHVKYPCWNLIDKDKPTERWLSLEGDTTINRAGWFWHKNQSGKVKSPETLMQVYMDCVGRGANLILNVAADTSGHLDPADVQSLLCFGEMRRRLLAEDFALGAKAKANEVRGNSSKFAAANVTDGNIESYWCPEDKTTNGELVITLKEPATFDVVRLREQIRLGQRVEKFNIDAFVDGAWKTVDDKGETIGNQVMRKLESPITTDRVRVRITASRACPCISEVSLLRMPNVGDIPSGLVVEATNDIKLDSSTWKPLSANAAAALDGKPKTHWHTNDASNALVVDMGQVEKIKGFTYLPRQDEVTLDMTDHYIFEVSTDGKKWKKVSSGEFSNIRANPIELSIYFDKPVQARFFKFTGDRALEGKGASAAEIGILASE